jgi:hypothetical protein
MSNTTDYSGVTYNGVALTEQLNFVSGGLSQRWAFFTLEEPDTGSNNLLISFTASQFNSISIAILSFTGSGGIGAVGNNDEGTTPNSQSLVIGANSYIYATGASVNAQSFGYQIGGDTLTNLFAHNTNRQVEGALSNPGLIAGATNVTTRANFGTISNARIEISDGGGSSSGNFMLLF